MKFIILNGSPKGNKSITLQYLFYIKKYLPEHEYIIYNVGRKIKKIEKDETFFNEIMESINESDGIIWIYPVYIMLIPSQLKRFIELIFERKGEKNFKNKYATSISTSERFYDHTAHNFIHGISEDLNLRYYKGFSARMFDLMENENRQNLLKFIESYFKQCEIGRASCRERV